MLRKLLLVIGAALLSATAFALINPNFTPIHLLDQSETVLVLKFDAAPKDGKVTATVVKALKGEKPAEPIVLDLDAGAFPAQGKDIAEIIGGGAKEGIFFVGAFADEAGGGAAGNEPRAMLHVGGKWVTFLGADGGAWDMERISAQMLATWAGSTDMLLRVIEYIQSDPDADVPVRANVEWDTPVKFANVPGKVTGARTVFLDDKLCLLIARDGESKLFAWKAGAMAEVPAADPLFARAQSAGVAQLPKLVKTEDEAGLGAQGSMFHADFDGDGNPDVIVMFEKGSLFYKRAADSFLKPARAQIFLGKGKSTAQLGDYDADGLLDIFTSAEDGNRLWQNLGDGKFINRLGSIQRPLSGEIDYISKPGGVDGITGDINDDGRQDILIAYAEMPPHIFFNRGFRAFGHAHEIDLGEQKLVEESGKGQQACAMADFNGDGAQDMVLVLKNGDAWLFPRKVVGGKALSVTVSLGKDAPSPLLVVGYSGKRCLGAWNVTAGGNPAFFGMQDAGTVTLKWKLPDGSDKSAKVDVIDRPVRYVVAN